MKRTLLAGTLVLTSLSAAHAASITYVDAVVAGMTGTVNTTGPSGNTAVATAWQIRGLNGGPAADVNNFSNGGSALQYNTNPIDATNPTLTTTLTGLNPSLTYRFYVVYWDDVFTGGTPAAFIPATAATAWDVNAKLSSAASYTAFDSTSAGSAYIVTTDAGQVGGTNTTGGYNNLTLSELVGLNVLGQAADTFVDAYDGNRAMILGALPTLGTGSSSYAINVQPGTFNAQRSWYDGIAYEVVPEPSSVLLLGMIGLVVLRRRR